MEQEESKDVEETWAAGAATGALPVALCFARKRASFGMEGSRR
jgi:hypothetical protein